MTDFSLLLLFYLFIFFFLWRRENYQLISSILGNLRSKLLNVYVCLLLCYIVLSFFFFYLLQYYLLLYYIFMVLQFYFFFSFPLIFSIVGNLRSKFLNVCVRARAYIYYYTEINSILFFFLHLLQYSLLPCYIFVVQKVLFIFY